MIMFPRDVWDKLPASVQQTIMNNWNANTTGNGAGRGAETVQQLPR